MTAHRKLPAAGRIAQIARLALMGLLIAYWAWLLFDLVTHPLAAGPNPAGALFRWLSALTGTATLLIALFIMRRVPGNPIGMLLFLYGIGTAGWSIRTEWANLRFGILAVLTYEIFYYLVSGPALFLMLFYFPNGKPFPPRLERWMPVITALLVVTCSFFLLNNPTVGSLGKIPNPLFIPALKGIGFGLSLAGVIASMSAALITLVLRYRNGNERLRSQIKWMAWLLGVCTLLAGIPFNSLGGPFYLIGQLLQTAFFVFLEVFPALGIGIAVLRHNLWGIDILIRRTLVYSLLTGLLALVYFSGVALLQAALAVFGGQSSPVVIVITTLLIAALFNPLRRRIQDFIDWRFYRRKYNAEKALAEFAAAARSETDLKLLTIDLVHVVQETLQPADISVWTTPLNTHMARQSSSEEGK